MQTVSPPSGSPHPEQTSGGPPKPCRQGVWGWPAEARRPRPRGPPPPARAPLTCAGLRPPDLPQQQDHGQEVAQVAEDTEHVHGAARGPRTRAQPTPGKLSGGRRGCHVPGPDCGSRGPCPRLRAPSSELRPVPALSQRALGRAVTWPGRPRTREPGSAAARRPAPGPSQGCGSRRAGRPGQAGGFRPGPPLDAEVALCRRGARRFPHRRCAERWPPGGRAVPPLLRTGVSPGG